MTKCTNFLWCFCAMWRK